VVLQSTDQLRCLAFNPRDQQGLAGGTINGGVGVWDVRRSQGPMEFSATEAGHKVEDFL